jgi:hypothetical protein
MVAKEHVCQCTHLPSKGVISWEKINNYNQVYVLLEEANFPKDNYKI